MATVNGISAEEMQRLANEEITSAQVDDNGHLILITRGGIENDVGRVRGDPGPMGPAGTVHAYAGDTPPAGWLLCNGSTVSRTTYKDLYSVIGTKYGSGNGTTTFTLPDLTGRTIFGYDAGEAEFTPIAKKGGTKTHSHTLGAAYAMIALSTSYLRAAAKSVASWTTSRYASFPTTDSTTDVSGGTPLGGSTDTYTLLPPYIVMQYIIKAS